MAAGPRAPAAGGGRRWQRRRSGRVEVAWSGQEASPLHEGASGVLDLGRGRKEERFHGEQGGGGGCSTAVGCSSENWARGRGGGASRGQGGTAGGVNLGGAAVEVRLDGGLRLAGVR